MSCCCNTVCLLCTICFVIGLVGVMQIILGISGSFLETDVIAINDLLKTEKFDSYLSHTLLMFIGLGALSLILALFSIYGIMRRKRSLSMFMAILWVFTMVLNIALILVALFYIFNVTPNLKSSLTQTLRNSRSSIPIEINRIQSHYKCCGIQGEKDYREMKSNLLPESCCNVPNCWNETDSNLKLVANETTQLRHKTGCFSFINEMLQFEIWVIFGVSASCTILQFLALTLMCVLCERYRKFEKSPTFTLTPIKTDPMVNETMNVNNNNNNNCDIDGSSQTLEETVEITQI